MTKKSPNRIAMVTGVGRRKGIGAAIAHTLAEAGFDIFITWYHPFDKSMPWFTQDDDPAGILVDLRKHGVRAEGMEADLGDINAPAALFESAERSLGNVDILINNATYDTEADIYAMTPEILDKHYAINVRGTTLLCAEFAHHHNGRPGGRIINLTSGQGMRPMPNTLAYAMTKGASDILTTSLSASLAPKGITVNAIDPGPTDSGWMSPELHRSLAGEAPFGRVGTPKDAAKLIKFLVSEEGQWVTGQILRSRGGM